MALSPADIKRADIQSFRDVATALDGMATANNDMKTGVGRLPIAGDAWKGVSGDAAHHELDGFGKLLSGSAESKTAAAAQIRRAADEFEGVKQLLAKIEKDAANGKFTIDMATGKVTPPQGDYDKNELSYIQNTLRQLQQAGDAANADLAAAVKAAKEPPAGAGPSGALPTTPNSAVKPDGVFGGVQNLATANPDGEPGATKAAAAAGTDTQANYKEWYPKTPGAGDKLTIDPSKAGSLTGTVGALDKMPGAPKPQDGFGSGVAKQFLKGANARIDETIDEVKSKAGLNGADKFTESWTNSAKGLEHQIERTLFPGAAMAEDAKNMIDQAVTSYQHPEKIPENIGKTTVDAAIAGTTVPLGGEGALARTGLEDASIAGRGGLLDTPHVPHDMAPTPGHTSVEPPSAHPGPVADHSPPAVDHPAPPPDHTPPPPPQHHLPTPDTFDPSAGQHYASGDPHHPGGWPPHTPEQTWNKGDPNPGWEHVNRGPEKPWMDYQSQITGIERTPDGRIPEYVMTNPETGEVVRFDSGPIERGNQQIFLDAKHNYAPLFESPGKPWTQNIEEGLIREAERQLDVLPPGTGLEWHVANPQSAAIIRNLLVGKGLDVDVIYTPEKP
ncbi:Tox-REase-5 domain-containing protein [Mycobacteroides abscessus]|uniref:Tox-REase-5 domain-containing protein n=1 Tax=Mycobacteroides abscessus TaxID=36809 RepID=UPI00092BBAD7|nr:Tox-REase-5 domain-containing protein [Mycobacteroides abscessus]SIB68230.1 Alpha/beta hydrolase of uncharacterised function (DUF1023) [Mycobacteroides abscessus subsp. bolletii]SKT71684.1 Alpha/beta hydrolase of uncharacterised function (DUF1023) [Mycobacteroides abscessus subsp. bolletii]